MKSTLVSLVLGSVSWLGLSLAHGAPPPYPSKPITVIVPFSAGGVVDVQTRAVTQRLAVELGQPIVVEAKSGAGGNIAADFVARAAADGYTLLVSAPYITLNPLLENSLRWSPKSFAPVARFAQSPSYLVVPASSPVQSLKEFVQLAKKATPPLQFASGGVGTTQDMAVQMLQHEAGIRLEAVLYKGAPPMIPDLLNAVLPMSVVPSSVAYPHILSGRLRALANTSGSRSTQLPKVPTIAEAGYPGSTALSWYGLHAPAGTPPEIIQKLEAAIQAATRTPEVRERLVSASGEEAFLNTADFAHFVKTDAQRWEAAVKAVKP
ncbi:tripartite tricarboxylate transporter substrate binding protein [Acidovorax sp. Be4]|uniref:Tripartite tricarboxylate transporter substrate binding protein n=1 Tax=Acidovorax bellezanensis TaxID=2976702 RepID=A0ABT2PJL2_9BURK|nr:tripartite tricarboxylate transporter substrate binding protein [Acidovorax sp. Be4]MCT9810671.1 tripartite tricarboxylate transporter substrate binding protein [Acidovorax sp. Be4]